MPHYLIQIGTISLDSLPVAGGTVILRAGQIYRCTNADCRAEIQVLKPSVEGESSPKCCCGAEMKKPYSRPTAAEVTSPDLRRRFETDCRPADTENSGNLRHHSRGVGYGKRH